MNEVRIELYLIPVQNRTKINDLTTTLRSSHSDLWSQLSLLTAQKSHFKSHMMYWCSGRVESTGVHAALHHRRLVTVRSGLLTPPSVIPYITYIPNIYYVRAVATAPEKTPTEKVKFSELWDHHQSIPRQILALEKKRKKKKKKVATPYLHGASAIRPRRPRRRPPDALNVILRLNRCLDGMR